MSDLDPPSAGDEPGWEIPARLQPDPDECAFDLVRTLRSVVGLRAHVPTDAYTAGSLGTERLGSGVVIGNDGLVLTIGYLVTEAESVWLSTTDGRAVPAHVLAFDQPTGFGLVQALGLLGVDPLPFGDSDAVGAGASVIVAAAGGREHAVLSKVISKQPFAGYWEYLLEEAFFTAPAHPFWSGAALLGEDGRLLGIGSLILQQGDGAHRIDMNMLVPIGLLPPILDDLRTIGQSKAPPRPWLGLYATETDGGVVVGGTASNGPAARAGLRQGDRILSVGVDDVDDLAALWRQVWAAGPAGTPVVLRVERGTTVQTVRLVSADRAAFLRRPRLH